MEINLERLLSLFWVKLKYIIITALIAAIGMYFFSEKCIDKTYTTDAKFMVKIDNAETSTVKTNEASFAQNTVTNYTAILKSRDFYRNIAEVLNEKIGTNSYDENTIKSITTITVNPDEEDSTFKINVVAKSPEAAYEILNTMVSYTPEIIKEKDENLNALILIESPKMPEAPSAPNSKSNAIYAFIIGFVGCICFIYFREIFDNRIKNVQDITGEYDISLLGVIPNVAPSVSNKSSYTKYGKYYYCNSYSKKSKDDNSNDSKKEENK